MFHLSLPVPDLDGCVRFYRDCLDARIVMLGEAVANIFVFGGQLTLHQRPDSSFGEAQRREMHFGAVVEDRDWFRLRDRIAAAACPILACMEPDGDGGRGKLLFLDPGGNIVEINGGQTTGG